VCCVMYFRWETSVYTASWSAGCQRACQECRLWQYSASCLLPLLFLCMLRTVARYGAVGHGPTNGLCPPNKTAPGSLKTNVICLVPPHLHLTTSKVMVIVWRLRGNRIRTVLYIANVLPLQRAQLKKTVHTARLGLEFVFLCFLGCMIIFMLMCVLFYLGQLRHFLSCLGAGVTNLNEPPSSFLLPPCRCGLGAGSIPLRAIVNKKQCETRGLFMSLVIRYWIGDVQDSQGVSVSQNANYNF